MDNTAQSNSSTTLIIGIILGVLLLGGIFLYMRGNGSATNTSGNRQPVQDSIEADVTIPIRNDAEQTQQ